MTALTLPSRIETHPADLLNGESIKPGEMVNVQGGLEEWEGKSLPSSFARPTTLPIEDAQLFERMGNILKTIYPLINDSRAMSWAQLNHVKALIAELAIETLVTGRVVTATSISPLLTAIHTLGENEKL